MKKPRAPKVKRYEVIDGEQVEVKRKPSAYNQFVKEHYSKLKEDGIDTKERFQLLAKMWSEHKASLEKKVEA